MIGSIAALQCGAFSFAIVAENRCEAYHSKLFEGSWGGSQQLAFVKILVRIDGSQDPGVLYDPQTAKAGDIPEREVVIRPLQQDRCDQQEAQVDITGDLGD